MQTLQEIAEIIKQVKSAVIFTHMRPDGDAVGSAMSLFFACRYLGIPCEVADESDIPEKFTFFPEVGEIVKTPTLDAEAYICVDSADEFRLGLLSDVFLAGRRKKITINIDHHISNTRFAQYNYVRECSSNCENMLTLIELMGVPLEGRIADFLLLGILTDSGNFSHSDVNAETFLAASKLSAAGAKPDEINYNVFKKQKKARALLYADTLSRMRFLLDDRLAVLIVRQEDLKKYAARQDYTEGFVDFPLSIDTVEVSVSIMETKRNQYKISLRSKGKVNVNAVAAVYGGGGHVLASGCMLFGDIEEVIDKLQFTVSRYL